MLLSWQLIQNIGLLLSKTSRPLYLKTELKAKRKKTHCTHASAHIQALSSARFYQPKLFDFIISPF